MELHLDLLGGIAGDMFAAALLDIDPGLETGLREALALAPLPKDISISVEPHNDGTLTGRRFLVTSQDANPCPDPGHGLVHHYTHGNGAHWHHDHMPRGGHDHFPWRDIRAALETSALNAVTKSHAIAIFALLAEAEARVHGMASEDVVFHEVGAWDSIADIVSAAWLIGALGVSRCTAGAVPLGSGRVRSAHGVLPVPAPATALLLEGFSTLDDGIAGERVTPTGAAILRHLCKGHSAEAKPRRLLGSGFGFGTKSLPGIANCLRVLAFEPAERMAAEQVAVLECEIDDQTAEDLAIGLDRLRAHAGVLDVVQTAVFGKKGRMMISIRVLARREAQAEVAAAIFEETSTIGIRHALVGRSLLQRTAHEIDHGGQTVKLKASRRRGDITVKAAADDVACAGNRAARERLRRDAEAAFEKEWS